MTGSGDVYVTTTGDSTSGAEGINAVSQANAKADVSGTSVTQSNLNRLSGTTGAAVTLAPVLQSQSASQTNSNEQAVFAIAATFAGDVTVNSYGELDAGGTGVNAVSTTSAVALRSGTVTQTNDNGVAGTASTVPANLGLVDQSQDISQTNDSEQFALVGAIASSGDISVTRTGKTKSDANGINAVSIAAADAESASTVTQTNKNVATATGVIVDQTQSLEQQNDNEDFLIVGSLAHSGDVSVTSSGKTEAELNGINAKSLTLAESSGKQTATQTNDNGPAQDAPAAPTGAIATGALVTQGQDVSQENNNLQLGAAISIALSGSTTVTQEDTAKAKADGIVAQSGAKSIAALDQSATQTNTNGAAATLNTANITILDTTLAGSLGEQDQGIEQLNTNLQGGAAFALSDADGVDVYSDKVSAGGVGITASSSANSSANLGQSVNQTNRNSAAISFPPVGVQTPNNTTNPLEVGIQSEEVEQVNLNAQLGVSAATSFSDYVNVQAGEVAAGDDGIVAASNAVSNAELSQSADQKNEDSQVDHAQAACHCARADGRIADPGGYWRADRDRAAGQRKPASRSRDFDLKVGARHGDGLAGANGHPCLRRA